MEWGNKSLTWTAYHNSCGICYSVSHTTRQMRKEEEQGKDYSFVTRDVFLKGIETVSILADTITVMMYVQGEFLETSSEDQELFGLSSMALEQVACQGLACVVHMNLQVYTIWDITTTFRVA